MVAQPFFTVYCIVVFLSMIHSVPELLQIVTYDEMAAAAYNAARGFDPPRHHDLSDRHIATEEGWCDVAAPGITDLLRRRDIAQAQGEEHGCYDITLGGSEGWWVHAFTGIPHSPNPLDDLVVDATYLQFVPPKHQQDLPNVYLGERREIISLMTRLGVGSVVTRLYLPASLIELT